MQSRSGEYPGPLNTKLISFSIDLSANKTNEKPFQNIGSLEGALQYYHHATPREPAGFSRGCMVIVPKGSF